MYSSLRALRRADRLALIITAGVGAALLIAVLLVAPSGLPESVDTTGENAGPIRAGLCVTGLPPGAKDDPTRTYGVHRIACRDPEAQLRIMYRMGLGYHDKCANWLVTVSVEQFCAQELQPTATPG
jgi:hypothetical protein